MLKKLFILLILVLLLFSWLVEDVRAREAWSPDYSKSEMFKKSIQSSPGKTIYIETSQADIHIIGTKQNKVSTKATVEVRDEDKDIVAEYLAAIKLNLEPYRDGFRLRIRIPGYRENRRHRSNYSKTLRNLFRSRKYRISTYMEIRILIPSEYNLDIDNRYGDIEIRNVSGDILISNTSGKVGVEKCSGELTVRNSYAKVDIFDFKGPVDLKNSSGS